MHDLRSDKTIYVSGATGFLGSQIALMFAEAGASLVLLGRDTSRLHNLVNEHPILKRQSTTLTIDYNNPEQVTNAIAAQKTPPDILVNCLGHAQDKPFVLHSDGDATSAMQANVSSVITLCEACLPIMCAHQHGTIINMVSITGLVGQPMRSLYGAAKGAVIAYSKAIARRYASQNIRVNCVAPQVVSGGLADSMSPKMKANANDDADSAGLRSPRFAGTCSNAGESKRWFYHRICFKYYGRIGDMVIADTQATVIFGHSESVALLEHLKAQRTVSYIKADTGLHELTQQLDQLADETLPVNTVVIVVPMHSTESEHGVDVPWINAQFEQLFTVARVQLQNMMAQEMPGQLVFLQSFVGEIGHPDYLNSATLGGATLGLMKCLAKEVARYSISVNCISVGSCPELGMVIPIPPEYQRMFDFTGLGKEISLVQLTSAIESTEKSGMAMTGQIMRLDGGLVI